MKKFFEVLIKIFWLLFSWAMLNFLIQRLITNIFPEIKAYTSLLPLLAPAVALTLAVLLSLLFFRVIDSQRVKFCLTTRFTRDLGLSVFVGFFWVGGTIGLFALNDSLLFNGGIIPQNAVVWILVVTFNVLTQELLLRGYIFSLLMKKYGGIVSITTTSFLFLLLNGTALASGPVPIFFSFAASTLYGLLRFYTGGILAPILVHLFWNIIGGFVFGGVPLGENVPSVWKGIVQTVTIATDGDLKFEGSTIALLITIFLIDLIVILIQEKLGQKESGKILAK